MHDATFIRKKWRLRGRKRNKTTDTQTKQGTQRTPTPSNTDPKSFKQTKTAADPSDKRLYEPYPPDSDADTDVNMETDNNDAMDTDDNNAADTPKSSLHSTTGSKSKSHPEWRLKPTILQQIAHILDTFADAPRISQWCSCILSLLKPEPGLRVMTASELAQMLQPDTEVDGLRICVRRRC